MKSRFPISIKSDTDTDSDGAVDCNDNCPIDPNKVEPGLCGCGIPEDTCNDDKLRDDKEVITSKSDDDDKKGCFIAALTENSILDLNIFYLFPSHNGRKMKRFKK